MRKGDIASAESTTDVFSFGNSPPSESLQRARSVEPDGGDYVFDSDDDVGDGEHDYTGRHDRDWVAEWVRSTNRARGTGLPPLPHSSVEWPTPSELRVQQGGRGVHFRPPSPPHSVGTAPSEAAERDQRRASRPSRERRGAEGIAYLGSFGAVYGSQRSAGGSVRGSAQRRRSPLGRGGAPSERSARTAPLSEALSFHHAPEGSVQKIGWPTAALIFYAFSMPSAVGSAASMVGSVGWAASLPLCAASCAAAACGAWMLAEVAIDAQASLRVCHTFGDVGRVAFGELGQLWGNAIQCVHLFLLLPVCLMLGAEGMAGLAAVFSGERHPLGHGGPGSGWVLGTALLCLVFTQMRSAASPTFISLATCCSVAAVAALQVAQAMDAPVVAPAAVPPDTIGNPAAGSVAGAVRALSGVSLATWSYVPNFLAAELAHLVRGRRDLRRALFLSALLSAVTMVLVGWTVTAQWGWQVANPITTSRQWPRESLAAGLTCVLLLLCNLATFCLDAACLGRAWMVWTLGPSFAATDWSPRTCARTLFATLPIVVLSTGLALWASDLTTLVTLPAFVTVPAAAQVYPAACYAAHFVFPSALSLFGHDAAPKQPRPAKEHVRFSTQVKEVSTQGATEGTPLLMAIPRVQSGSIHDSDGEHQGSPNLVLPPSSQEHSRSPGQAHSHVSGPTRSCVSILHSSYAPVLRPPRRGAALPLLLLAVGMLSFGVSAAACAGKILFSESDAGGTRIPLP
eukprot:TRINITY_DN30337_c0_g1_i1.p1 TRINITY_DN30337_c0_g1~~TRINITY_DN30337_c0_g1_i1.p1  ORF type:complete len:766 (+),score=162.45 TRINITY_DN30337_c0_g1_i1:80-2299(+)